MLKKFENNNIHRKKVLEFIKNGKWNLEKFGIEEFNEYPGGMALIDSKGRRIIIYDDFIMEKTRVIYEKLKQKEEDIFLNILDKVWENYSNNAQLLGEIARLRRDEKGNIIFYRYKINEQAEAVKSHISEQFEENNQLYDIYEYLKKEIKKMKKNIKNNSSNTNLYYEM